MANKLFAKVLDNTDLLLGETGGVDHDEATIETDVDNYGGTNIGKLEFNVALGNDGTKKSETLRPTVNISLPNWIKYLARKLNSRYFQVANLFSELDTAEKKASARGVLDIKSSEETDTAVNVAVAAAFVADTTTLKVNNQLADFISYQGVDCRPQVQANLDVYSRAATEDKIDEKIEVLPTYLERYKHFEEYTGEGAQGGTTARNNLDVYNKADTITEIRRATTKGIIKLTNVGDNSYGTPITAAIVQAGVAIGTDIRVTDNCQSHILLFVVSLADKQRIRLPSITDDPTLKEGAEVTILNDYGTPEGASDRVLQITGYNILPASGAGEYFTINTGNGCKLVYCNGMWRPVANINTFTGWVGI